MAGSDDVIREAIAGTGFSLEGGALVAVHTFRDFREAMAYVNRVAGVAEERNHHPDIAIHWNRVTLRLWTHTAGAVTEADVDLARAIAGLAAPPGGTR